MPAAGAKPNLVDPGQLARLGSLRLYTAADSPDFHRPHRDCGLRKTFNLFVAASAQWPSLAGNDSAMAIALCFQRFRWRFICAPIFLIVVTPLFLSGISKGIVLVAFVWGVWHGMMQTYGFCRIYDAKVGSSLN